MDYFVDENEEVRIEVNVDTSGKRPKVLIEPSLDFLMINPQLRNEKGESASKEDRQKIFKEMKEIFDESVSKPDVKKEWILFRYWDYELQDKINGESRVANLVTGEDKIDYMKQQRVKLKYLLKDWSIADKEGKKVELEFDEVKLSEERKVKILTPKSLKKVLKLHPDLLLGFLNKLDRVLYLSEEESKN